MSTPAPYPRCVKHDMLMQRGIGNYSKKLDCPACIKEKTMAKKKQDETPGIGHNSNVSGARLKSFLERIERLEDERSALAEDVKDIYSEAKATGFEPKIIKKIISLRKKSIEARREESELTSLYLSAMGMAEDLAVFG